MTTEQYARYVPGLVMGRLELIPMPLRPGWHELRETATGTPWRVIGPREYTQIGQKVAEALRKQASHDGA